MPDIEWSEMVGGGGGGAFDDYQANANKLGKITKIQVQYGDWVNSVVVYYDSEPTPLAIQHGGNGPAKTEWELEPDEYIVQIDGNSGYYINNLTFTTNKQRISPSLGSSGGGSAFPSISSTTPDGDPRYVIAFGGRSGTYLDALKFLFADDPVVSVEVTDIKITVNEGKPATTYPLQSDPVTLTNHGSAKQRLVHVFSWTESSTLTVTTGIDVTTGALLRIGWDFLEKLEAEFSLSVGVTHTDAEATTDTSKREERMHIDVPGNSIVQGKITAQRKTYRTEFTGTAKITYVSGLVETKQISEGLLTAAHEGFDINVEWDPAKPIQPPD